MNIMTSWMTLDELGWANTKRNYKGRDGQSLVKISPIDSRLGCTFVTVVRLTITTIGATLIYH